MPVFAFILLGILMLAFAGIALFFFLFDHRDKFYRYEDDDLINGSTFNCEFKRIGGSKNEHTSIKLQYNGGNTANILYSSKPHNGAKTTKKELSVSKDAVEKLRDLYRKHCIPALSDCVTKEEFVLDAPIVIVTFSSGEKSYTINSDQDFPEKNRGVIDELCKALMSFLQ